MAVPSQATSKGGRARALRDQVDVFYEVAQRAKTLGFVRVSYAVDSVPWSTTTTRAPGPARTRPERQAFVGRLTLHTRDGRAVVTTTRPGHVYKSKSEAHKAVAAEWLRSIMPVHSEYTPTAEELLGPTDDTHSVVAGTSVATASCSTSSSASFGVNPCAAAAAVASTTTTTPTTTEDDWISAIDLMSIDDPGTEGALLSTDGPERSTFFVGAHPRTGKQVITECVNRLYYATYLMQYALRVDAHVKWSVARVFERSGMKYYQAVLEYSRANLAPVQVNGVRWHLSRSAAEDEVAETVLVLLGVISKIE